MASEDFNKSSKNGWRIYGEVSGFTSGVMLGMFSLAMAMKPGASGWWTAAAIAGGLCAIGSVISLFSGLNKDVKDTKHTDKKDGPAAPGPKP